MCSFAKRDVGFKRIDGIALDERNSFALHTPREAQRFGLGDVCNLVQLSQAGRLASPVAMMDCLHDQCDTPRLRRRF